MRRSAEDNTARRGSWQKRKTVAKGECGEAGGRDLFGGKAQRDVGRGCMSPPDRFQSLCIGQPQVKYDNVNCMGRKMLLGLTHGFCVRQFGLVRALILERLAEQAGVSEVIFDQQKCFD